MRKNFTVLLIGCAAPLSAMAFKTNAIVEQEQSPLNDEKKFPYTNNCLPSAIIEKSGKQLRRERRKRSSRK